MGQPNGPGQVTIESAPGLLDSVRQSLDVLQRGFGGNPQGQGLLAPLLQHHDLGHLAGSGPGVPAGHGSVFGSPQCPIPPRGGPLSYGPTIELGPQPRVLEPYPMATPPPMSGANVNPFWSTQARAHPGEGGVVPEGMRQGEVRRSPNYVDVEAIREKVLREAENLFAKEIKKATGGAESSSFESVPSADREPGRSTVGVMGPGGGGNGGESTRRDGRGSQPHGLERPPGLQKEGVCEGPLNRSEPPQGTVNEVFRSLELPPLPSPGSDGASLAFGDWLTVAMPLMSDLSSSARGWWQANIMDAEALHETWLKLKPLERLRLKVDRPLHPSYERVEHRGVTILLGVLPDQVRRDVIASRKVSCLGILFRLYTIFQPGGSAERTALLKSITELKVGNGVADVLSGIRQWRRWIQRAQELGLTTPDPLVLVQVLNRVTEALGRHGGAQVSFRMATARQELAVDQCPTMESIMEYAEYVQAEAEDLALMTGSSKTPAAGANVNMSTAGGTAPKAAAFNTTSSTEEKPKASCKFWGSAQGCRRGDQCTYGHSWEGINKQNRCFVCSGEGHMSRECPTRRELGIAEATSLLKSLRTLKACRLKQICRIQPGGEHEGEVALLDGGATHPLRMAEVGEKDHLIPVQVELAHGSTTLYRKEGCSTLLSLDEVEPIIPLSLLVQHGFRIDWSANGCTINHPRQGPILCWLRGGRPVMKRSAALAMLREFEELEKGHYSITAEDAEWWEENIPGVSGELLEFMKGQSWCLAGDDLPWNRRQRRMHQTSKGIIVHLFSGANVKRWRDSLPSGYTWLFLDPLLGSRYDLHSPLVGQAGPSQGSFGRSSMQNSQQVAESWATWTSQSQSKR